MYICSEQAYQTMIHWAVTWPLFPCSLSTKTPSGNPTGASAGTAGAMVNMSMVVDGECLRVRMRVIAERELVIDGITDMCGHVPEIGLFIPPALRHGRHTLSVYTAYTYVALKDKLTTNATNCVRTRRIFGNLGELCIRLTPCLHFVS